MAKDDKLEIGLFDQIDEALEEREGSDRRKKNLGTDLEKGEDRRKSDRREQSK